MKWGIRRIQKWNSRIFDLSDPEDLMKYRELQRTLRDFDFTWLRLCDIYSLKNLAYIQVELKPNDTMEIWLLKHGFEKA